MRKPRCEKKNYEIALTAAHLLKQQIRTRQYQRTCATETGPSAAIEADIIVSFNRSMDMHGIKYLKFITDGDSSVHANNREKVWYGGKVEQFVCVNHVLKKLRDRHL